MPYYITDENTTADLCLAVTGDDFEEILRDSARGITAIIAETHNLKMIMKKRVKLSADTIEELYFSWLSELIYLKDTCDLLPMDIEIKSIDETDCKLEAEILGDMIDSSRHILKVDIKAVTFYKFSLKKEENKWRGKAVLDL